MNKGNNQEKSALDSMQERLNSKGEDDTDIKEHSFRKKAYDVKREWSEKFESGEVEDMVAKKRPFFEKLLIISAVFFLVAVAVSAGLFLLGSNSISTDNVVINASGPSRVPAGEPASFDINILNKNNISLENAIFSVRYPENTRDADDPNKELKRTEEELGDIVEGERISKKISAIFFGEEGSEKEMIISIEYEVEGSTAVFEVEKSYSVVISSSPVSIEVDAPKQIGSGSEVEVVVSVSSNSNQAINDLALVASYPFGFEFVESDPSPDDRDNAWLISELEPDEERRFTIKGFMAGQDREERVFRFTAGIGESDSSATIRTPISSNTHEITISKPVLAIRTLINDKESPEVAISQNDVSQVDVAWENNSTDRIFDMEIEVLLTGEVLNERSIEVSNGGFYRSSENKVIWNSNNTPALREISPGQGGSASFVFRPINFTTNYPENPSIEVNSNILGSVPTETGQETRATNKSNALIKVSTIQNVTSRLLREEGPIENQGPIPPRAEEETTYTVHWSLQNTVNPVEGARVVATLPPYVEWGGVVSPEEESENVRYISAEREVVWQAGTVPRQAGFGVSPKEVYFQIVLEPSQNQVGDVIPILSETNAVGTDSFTGLSVGDSAQRLDSRFSDSSYSNGDGRVGASD